MRFIKMLIVASLIFLMLGVWAYHDTYYPQVSELDIKIDKALENDLRILHVSDTHGSSYLESHVDMFKELNKNKFDFLVLTGDMIDVSTEELEGTFKLIDQFKTLSDIVFYVNGNHEMSDRKKRFDRFIKGLESRDVIILNNDNVNFNGVNICGVDSVSFKLDDINKAMKDIDESQPTILLSHNPNIYMKSKEYDIDLLLSGHTHGGQIRLPFIGALITPNEGIFPKYDKGLFDINDGQQMYINAGFGPHPPVWRFNNKAEVTIINVQSIENKE